MYLVAKKLNIEGKADFAVNLQKKPSPTYGVEKYVPVQYADMAAATTKAQEMAAKDPGQEYVVLAPVRGYRTTPAPVEAVPYFPIGESV